MATGSPQDETRQPSACRSLVAVRQRLPACPGERPRAGFLAQLIANDRRLPAYRTARLAEPTAAIGSYASIADVPVRVIDRLM